MNVFFKTENKEFNIGEVRVDNNKYIESSVELNEYLSSAQEYGHFVNIEIPNFEKLQDTHFLSKKYDGTLIFEDGDVFLENWIVTGGFGSGSYPGQYDLIFLRFFNKRSLGQVIYDKIRKLYYEFFNEKHKDHNLAPHHYTSHEKEDLMKELMPLIEDMKNLRKKELKNNKTQIYSNDPYIKGMYEGFCHTNRLSVRTKDIVVIQNAMYNILNYPKYYI